MCSRKLTLDDTHMTVKIFMVILSGLIKSGDTNIAHVSNNVAMQQQVKWFLLFLFDQSLRKVGQDSTVLLICITVFLSYLPEAGQYSSFFLYLRQVTLRSACSHIYRKTTTMTIYTQHVDFLWC